MSTHDLVFPFNQVNFSRFMGNSLQAQYIHQYLTALKAKTLVVEDNYIDKNYLIDYQKFYARSFDDCKRFTERIHFFSGGFPASEFERALESNKTNNLGEYLGFSVARPIQDLDGNTLIGRTLLHTYPDNTNGRKRFYVKADNTVSLFGISLNVKSIPFQAQDQGVSACATIALWTVLQSLIRVFGVQERSPAEITEIAMEFPSQSRVFPQAGLTLSQMVTCFRSADLDVEIIHATDNDFITTAVKAYTNAGIPLIGTLKLSTPESKDHHAVVIDGYQYDNNRNVTELYVHDDQVGPYSRVEPNPTFICWKNKWTTLGYKVELEDLLVPVYHKIRLPFPYIYDHYSSKKKEIGQSGYRLDLLLTTVQEYKNFLIGKQVKDKIEVLKKNLPRFLWIERVCETGKMEPRIDYVLDGTAIRPHRLELIKYQ